MDWTNETVMRFLELYKKHPCLWDPKNPYHKVKFRLNNAWVDIKNNLGEPCTVKELMKKKQSLMSAYRGYRIKIHKSEMSGQLDVYKPAWFAYSLMDSFLRPVYKSKLLTAVEDNENQDDADQSNAYNEPDIYEILDDTDDTNTAGETDTSNAEQESSHASMYYDTTNQVFFSAIPPKRKLHDPADLQEAKDHIYQAFNILKTVSQQTEDECDLFGKLIAKKMRRLTEDRRDLMMVKINKLFYEESH